MKKIIKKGLFITALVLVSKTIFAQTTIGYIYDDAGNRKSRYLVELPPPPKSATIDTTQIVENDTIPQNYPPEKNNLPKKNTQNEAVRNGNITLYPNPTAGAVELVVDGFDNQSTIEILVYDLKGTLLIKKNSTTQQTNIDLLSQPAGTYLVNIVTGGKVTEWKIIKE